MWFRLGVGHQFGAALYMGQASAAAIATSRFEQNEAAKGGGAIYLTGESTASITASHFEQNKAQVCAPPGGPMAFATRAE